MDEAVVGKEYVADLPPFSDSVDSKALVLRADPSPPEGLVFADLGAGFSRISGTPSKPGQYSFEISATNAAGRAARMTARIGVAPAPVAPAPAPPVDTPSVADTPPPNLQVADNPPNPAPSVNPPVADNPPNPAPPANPPVASLTPADRAADFMRSFDGGACFLARQQAAPSDSIAIEGIGSDKATFERFYGDFIHEIGAEPALTVRLIGAAECPAVDLIRAIGLGGAEAPKIDLVGYDVGRGRPLQGTISNLAGRRLDLLIVGSNGNVTRLDAKIQPGSGGAAFSAAVPPDATAGGALQLLLAIASTRPAHALEGFKAGPARDVLPRLREELPAASAALEVEFFKLVK
jgi:serine/threonine-protein kinase